jgi:FimV-like protein
VIDFASSPKAASERKTLWAWLSVFFIVGTLVGVGFLLWRRQKKSAMKCDPREQPVRFMKRTEGMTKEQEQGVQTMLSNRLEADKAAERGFVVRRQKPSTQDRLSETQGGFVGSPHRDEGAAEKNEAQQSQGTLSEVAMAEPKLGDISHLRNALTRAMQDQLDSAKEFMQVGADQQALKVLQQVMQQGNSEQKREAAEMMREIEAGQSGTSLT